MERYLPEIIRFLLENWPENSFGLLYNINFPDIPADQIKGVCITRQGRGHWEREFQEWDINRLRKYEATGFHFDGNLAPLEEGEDAYMMIGEFIDDEPGVEDADHARLEEGWITITPNNLDRIDFDDFKRLRSL